MKTSTHNTSKCWIGGIFGFLLVLCSISAAHAQILIQNSYTTMGEYDATTGAHLSDLTGLNTPVSLAISGNDLFIANAGSNSIGEYDATTGAAINANLVTGGWYRGLTMSGNELFASNIYNGTIGEYTVGVGAADGTITSQNTSLVGIGSNFMAVSGTHLFVVNNNAISEYDAISGNLINASVVSGLQGVTGLAISGNELFVAYIYTLGDIPGGSIGKYTVGDDGTLTSSNPSLLFNPYYAYNSVAVSGNDLFAAYIDPLAPNNNIAGLIGEYNASDGSPINPTLVTGFMSYSGPTAFAVEGVPEPSTWTMLVAGLGSLLQFRRRR